MIVHNNNIHNDNSNNSNINNKNNNNKTIYIYIYIESRRTAKAESKDDVHEFQKSSTVIIMSV